MIHSRIIDNIIGTKRLLIQQAKPPIINLTNQHNLVKVFIKCNTSCTLKKKMIKEEVTMERSFGRTLLLSGENLEEFLCVCYLKLKG